MDPDPRVTDRRVTPHADSDSPGLGAHPRRDRRRYLHVVVAGWALLLVAAAAVSARRDAPTVREQRNLVQVMPVVDRAIEDLIAAAGPDVVVELAGRRFEEGCRITPLRSGADLESTVVFRTSVADGASLLDRIAANLPAAYQAGTWRGSSESAPTLRADAGEFVAVRGTVTEPGVVETTLRTGCRPVPGDLDVQADLLPGRPIDDEPTRALEALGVTATAPVERVSAACAGGGAIHTAQAVGTAAGEPPLIDALPAPAGAVVVADLPDWYAYRHGSLSLVVEVHGGEVRAAATTLC